MGTAWRAALAAGAVFALTFGAVARADDRAYLDLTVNGVVRPATLAIVREHDVLVPLADLLSAGVPVPAGQTQLLDDRAYVSLAGLARVLSYTVDVANLRLSIVLGASALGRVSVDLAPAAPADLVPVSAQGGLIDYGVHDVEDGPLELWFDGRIDAGHHTVVESTGGRGIDGAFRRGLTALTFDAPAKLQRTVAGDTTIAATDFGGAVVAGGVTVARAFDENPYAIVFPLPATETTVLQPSQALIYVNGTLVKTLDLPPGVYDLTNVPLRNGITNAQVVVRDAFGQQTTLNTTLYSSAGLLRTGLTDYAFGYGFQRENIEQAGDRYGAPVASARYRAGLSAATTAGIHAENDAGTRSGGFDLDTLAGFGLMHLAFAASSTGPTGGYAATWGYATTGPHASANLQVLVESGTFATIGLPLASDRITTQWTLGASRQLGRAAQLALSVQASSYRDTPPVRSATLQYAISAGAGTLVVAAQHTGASGRTQNQLSVFYSRRIGPTTNQSVSINAGASPAITTDITHAAASPLDLQYHVAIDSDTGLPLTASATAGFPQAIVDLHADTAVHGQHASVTGDVAGAIAWIGGGTYLAQPVSDAWALVSAPGVAHAPVYLENQLVTYTDGRGAAVVGGLGSYQANRIALGQSTLPFAQVVSGSTAPIAPGYHGAAIVRYVSHQIHAVTGTVRTSDGAVRYGEVAIPANGNRPAFASPTDEAGRFYFDGVDAGTYTANVRDEDGLRCHVTFTVPPFAALEFDLGSVPCVP